MQPAPINPIITGIPTTQVTGKRVGEATVVSKDGVTAITNKFTQDKPKFTAQERADIIKGIESKSKWFYGLVAVAGVIAVIVACALKAAVIANPVGLGIVGAIALIALIVLIARHQAIKSLGAETDTSKQLLIGAGIFVLAAIITAICIFCMFAGVGGSSSSSSGGGSSGFINGYAMGSLSFPSHIPSGGGRDEELPPALEAEREAVRKQQEKQRLLNELNAYDQRAAQIRQQLGIKPPQPTSLQPSPPISVPPPTPNAPPPYDQVEGRESATSVPPPPPSSEV